MAKDDELIAQARAAALNAYAPYSKLYVGAAVLFSADQQDKVFTGCNVENASYGLTICAERVAISAGVAAGFRQIKKVAIAVLNEKGAPVPAFMPCGACRQFISEFAEDKTLIIVDNRGTRFLRELLPHSFEV